MEEGYYSSWQDVGRMHTRTHPSIHVFRQDAYMYSPEHTCLYMSLVMFVHRLKLITRILFYQQ